MRRHITIESDTSDEILALSGGELESLVIIGDPLAFCAGSAQILGEFCINDACLRVELAPIKGGGEGVLPTLWLLVERDARACDLGAIEWVMDATNGARPRSKLRPLLERRIFEARDVAGCGEARYLRDLLD